LLFSNSILASDFSDYVIFMGICVIRLTLSYIDEKRKVNIESMYQ